jgi:lysophospholipid acyltransferase (LPLAT)-like uncharacterized protein
VTTTGEPGWRASRWKRFEAEAIGAAGYPAIRLLGRTWRWRVDGLEHLDAIHAAGRQPLMAFWHGRILPALYYFRNRGIVVITSDNFDGEWIAKIIHRFGYSTVRGSTSRNAARAALRAKRRMQEGRAVGVTVDGPRGPALIVQPGAVWLAGATGNPILPFHLEAERHWIAPSWDSAQIPLPFSRIALVLGEPVWVAPASDDAAFEMARANLQQVLLALRPKAEALLRGTTSEHEGHDEHERHEE